MYMTNGMYTRWSKMSLLLVLYQFHRTLTQTNTFFHLNNFFLLRLCRIDIKISNGLIYCFRRHTYIGACVFTFERSIIIDNFNNSDWLTYFSKQVATSQSVFIDYNQVCNYCKKSLNLRNFAATSRSYC